MNPAPNAIEPTTALEMIGGPTAVSKVPGVAGALGAAVPYIKGVLPTIGNAAKGVAAGAGAAIGYGALRKMLGH
jgi:hypothetical protein